ncbi:unnamed protein product [Camellia sinensis]
MNTSQFMDKQIMDLSNSHNNNDFIDLMNPPHEHRTGFAKKDEIVPSYDFQPILQQSNLDSGNVGETRVWNSADSKTHATGIGIRNYSSLDSIEPTKVILEKDYNTNIAALVSEIDQTMKMHADDLLHALEGVSARISQIESRTRHLENSVDDLKVSVGNNHGSTDGKLRQMENILREVQSDVQVIRDKQDILEGQLHLAKLQMSKVEQQSDTQNTVQSDSLQLAASASQLSHQQLPPAITQSPSTFSVLQQAAFAPQQPHQQLPPPIVQSPSMLSQPNAPPPASQQNLPPSVPLPNQFPPNPIPSVHQREPYFPPPSQIQERQYQLPPPQHLQPPVPAPLHQQYQPPPPHPQCCQPPPQHHPSLSPVNPPQPQPQPQPSMGHHPDEAPPYAPPQNYPPSLHQQPPHPTSGNPPSHQFFGAPSHMYEPPSSRPNSGFSTAYGPSSGPNELYPYSGSASQYGSGSTKQQPSSVAAQGGGTSYPRLPTARILPQAVPAASGVGGGSGSSGTGNRVSIDDVVDKVVTMGFSRDQVRATVRKLTESGQSVDLNVVLDKLMNDSEGQPQRGWLGR